MNVSLRWSSLLVGFPVGGGVRGPDADSSLEDNKEDGGMQRSNAARA